MKKFYLLVSICSSVLLTAQIPTGAMGYWPFDNNALDYSGNGNHGTATNTSPTKDRFGNLNKAYHFNGTSSGVLVPNSPSIDVGPGQDFTFSIWEKAYNDNSNRTIMAKHVPGSWNGYWFGAAVADPGYCNIPQHIDFYTASGYQQDACSNTTIMQDSSWHLLTGVYKSATQMNYLYIDGVLQADSGQSSGTLSNSANLAFGFFDPDNVNFFHGALDEGRFYKKALTKEEILQLYNEPNPGTVGLQESETPLNIGVSPNPGNGLFRIELTSSTNTRADIYNALGQLVLSQQLTGSANIDLEHVAAGIYYLKINCADKQQILKLVKE